MNFKKCPESNKTFNPIDLHDVIEIIIKEAYEQGKKDRDKEISKIIEFQFKIYPIDTLDNINKLFKRIKELMKD